MPSRWENDLFSLAVATAGSTMENSWGWNGRRGREIKDRLSSSSLRGSCHPEKEIFQDARQRAEVKLFPSHPPKQGINHPVPAPSVRASHDTFHMGEATGGWHLPVAWPGADRIALSYPAVGFKCPRVQTGWVCSSCGPASTNRRSLTVCWEAQVQNIQKRCNTGFLQNIDMYWMCHLLISEYLTLSPSDSKQEGLVSFIYICLWIIY